MQDTTARVLSCEPLAQELVRLILSAPEIAAQAKAGQFIHMLVPDSGHVLRRPISLMAVDAAAFMLCGAKAVMVGTANFTDPFACPRIIRELDAYCDRQNVRSAQELVGTLEENG